MTKHHKMVKTAIQMWNSNWASFHHGTNMKPTSKRMKKGATF